MLKSTLIALAAAALCGCTTTDEIRRPGGETEYLVACGASTGWGVCYKQANKQCPTGYTTTSEKGGINRKELRFTCPKS